MPYRRNSELPENVRNALPEEAQTVFRNVFNQWVENHSEESSFRVAWTAVKNGWEPGEEGGKWVKKKRKSKDEGADSIQIEEAFTFDASEIRRTPEGFLIARPRVARSGIQVYRGREVGRPDLDQVRIYRPEDQVFSKDSMHTYAHRPVTNDHPPVQVDATNWKRFAVGQTGDEVLRDGQFIRVPMVLMDADTVRDVEDGKRELSLGYTMDLVWDSGETPDGQHYDAVQTSIRANHLAVVATARGGPDLRIGDDEGDDDMPNMKTITVDNVPVECSDVSAAVIQRHIASLESQIDRLKSKMKEDEESAKKKSEKDAADLATATANHTAVVATKDAEITALKKKVEDAMLKPEQIDTLVKDRAQIIEKAKGLLGDKLVVDGKSNADIRRQVVNAKVGDAAKGWSDDQIAASFGTLTVSSDGNNPLADAISHRPHSTPSKIVDAYANRDKRLENAWKGTAAA